MAFDSRPECAAPLLSTSSIIFSNILASNIHHVPEIDVVPNLIADSRSSQSLR